MPLLVTLFCLLVAASNALADSLLPADETFRESTPTPAATLGFEVGEWHARPEQIAEYFGTLAAESDRVSLQEIGRTHEQRPLIHAYITSPENQAKLEDLRLAHLQGEGPTVVWLGYSIHGDEASGSNAALATAYHLAAGEAGWIDELLKDTIVIIDPMFNPDGLARFATWANMHRGQQTVADRVHRAHWEAWPSGRFNHYWFDMNRDWLPATQPESVARLKQFHRWLPHVLGDFHEQGPDRAYFFQPGVPERKNPLTPDENVEITTELARYHAQALDIIGQPYYSRESFDDFYYGKGSTYPDINGSIGILFEQPSARGHRTESIYGEFTFTDAVRNQYLTSLSTVKGAHALKDRLRDYQTRFFQNQAQKSQSRSTRAHIFAGGEPRSRELVDLLRLHQIEVYPLGNDVESGDLTYKAGNAWVVPTRQRQAGLIEAMFERRGEFPSNEFYDVSAWTLPLAWNLQSGSLDFLPDRGESNGNDTGTFTADPQAVAYRLDANGYAAFRLVNDLLEEDLPVYRAGASDLQQGESSSYQSGHFVIPLRSEEQRGQIESLLVEAGKSGDLRMASISSGLNLAGADLGSPSLVPLKAVKPLLLVGPGINPMEAGHTWHLLDRRLGLATAMLDTQHPQPPQLNSYTHLLIPDADLSGLQAGWIPLIRAWVQGGGVLITQKDSARWAEALFVDITTPDEDDEDAETVSAGTADEDPIQAAIARLYEQKDDSAKELGRLPYEQYESDAANRVVGGAIFKAELDLTHPLAMGYRKATVPVFLNSTTRLQASRNAYSTMMVLADAEPIAGFASEIAREALAETPLIVADRIGAGLVIKFAFNPNFRAFWYGTEGLYINALMNAALISNTQLPPLPD